MKKKPEFTFMPPLMSWDIPIEQEILNYVRSMARSMESQQRHNIWGSVRKEAANYVDAYRTVEKHILQEIALRNKQSNV